MTGHNRHMKVGEASRPAFNAFTVDKKGDEADGWHYERLGCRRTRSSRPTAGIEDMEGA